MGGDKVGYCIVVEIELELGLGVGGSRVQRGGQLVLVMVGKGA